jgi:glycosyltransferase involved in cell wall biosynthesis
LSGSGLRRVAWIIGNLKGAGLIRSAGISAGGTPLVRYRWVSHVVNSDELSGFKYEIYRPWRRYDAVIFLKAMDTRAINLLRRMRRRGIPAIFDANVNYYELGGTEYYTRMLPIEAQRRQAIQMSTEATAVIADSEYIGDRCRRYNANVRWIPDNVRIDLVPTYRPYRFKTGKLRLLWCGQAVKLCDLLRIESILKAFAHHIELLIVTNSLSELDRIHPEYRVRLETLLNAVGCRVMRYIDPLHLFDVYAEGGVFLSPRFLDSPYNMGHTEWKIALPMACGRSVLCSPVPSYEIVSERAAAGIRVLRSDEEWRQAMEAVLAGECDLAREEEGAREVIGSYYSTEVVARDHTKFVKSVIGEGHH